MIDTSPSKSRRVLVHIGYHKTATTWLQRNIFGRSDRGFLPLAPASISHFGAAAKFSSYFFYLDDNGRMLSPFTTRTGEFVDLLSQVSPLDGAVPVISNERLCGNPHSGGFDAKIIAERLADALPQARILIVIREQVSVILSTYFQYLKVGGTRSLHWYLRQKFDGRHPGFTPAHFRYDRLIEWYSKLFGEENVLVLLYEQFRDNPVDFIAELAAFTGASVPGDLPYDKTFNKGLPRIVENRTRLLNLLTHSSSANGYSPLHVPYSKWPVRGLRRVMARFVPPSFERRFIARLNAEIESFIGDYYADSNGRTRDTTGLDLDSYGYKMPDS